tara:strand:- start:2118 stop:2486 length:369 start_codon:yes stop_codon:yes gene_type:complete
MTSTRNKNTRGDYLLEEQQFRKINEHIKYVHSSNGPPHSVSIPAGGTAPPSRMNRSSLSENSVDIESSLFGIGSSNLVKSTPKVVPKLNDLSTATFFVRPPLILPAPLIVEGYQRPFPNINS